jgi:5'-nucleotidase / UDP-sugar diphosphatase
MKILISLIMLLALQSCSSIFKKQEEVKFKLRVLHTNDHHGHYLTDKYGQYGMAARKTLIESLRKNIISDGGDSLLLSGGDINTGTMESDIFDAEPDFLAMKLMGYDAMAIGNHEFDNSYKVIKQQQRWAGFPFLSANIYWKGTNKRVFSPAYILREYKGIKVGIFGLTTIDTPFKASSDEAKKKFEFRSIIKSAKEVVSILKNKEKVDLIIVTTHVGHHGSLTSNGDIDLAKNVAGIDVIIGGHSQEIINAEVHNGTVIVQAEDWGKYVGVLDLYINKQNKRSRFEYELKPVNLKKKIGGKRILIAKEIKQDRTLQTFFSTYKFKADKIGKKVVGKIDGALSGERKLVRSQQMPIGQFVGESLMFQVKSAEVVVLNGGSIRATLNKGNISRKDLHNVHPYGNTIATVKFNATEFFEYMSAVAKYAIVDPKSVIGGYPQLSGMKITIKDNKLSKIEAKNGSWSVTKIGNKVRSNKKSFIVGTMNFLAKGGDNYPKLTGHPTYTDSGFMINGAMMNFIEAKKNVSIKRYTIMIKEIITIK